MTAARTRECEKEGERGVSPVIGVILMVAITVILAAVVGGLVLGVGGELQETPQVKFEFDEARDYVSGPTSDIELAITHGGGDTFLEQNVNVTVNGKPAKDDGGNEVWTGSGKITAGDIVVIDKYGTKSKLFPGDKVRIIWRGENDRRQRTHILTEYEFKGDS